MCMPFDYPVAGSSLVNTAVPTVERSWAARLLQKYGISEPMAPDDVLDTPSACSMATTAGMRRGE